MQRSLTILGSFLTCSLALAAGIYGRAPSHSSDPASAKIYAEQLVEKVVEVSGGYMEIDAHALPRTVTPSELVEAALKGLYEAAQVPVPGSLHNDVQEAATGNYLLLLARTRLALGEKEALRGQDALLVSFEAMTRILDPYSVVISGDDLNRVLAGTEGSANIGLEVVEKMGGGPLVVKTVAPGGPAQRGGLRPGDQILEINHQAADGLTSLEGRLSFSQLYEDPSGWSQTHADKVSLVVLRPGAPPSRKVTLSLETFSPETVLGACRKSDNRWDYWLDKENKIAHVRLAKIARGTGGDMMEVLESLRGEGLRGLILDLRWCPGGFLDEAASVARLFLRNCTIATLKGQNERKIPSDLPLVGQENATVKYLDFPIVVLVNGETSGGAEMIAAALQDNHRAVVAGQRSLGKASVQNLVILPINNTGMKITNGAFLRPSGKNLQHFPNSKATDDWGVVPNRGMELRISADLSRQVQEWWVWQTLRPGPSNEALPLDDPQADPQRQVALEILLEKIKEAGRVTRQDAASTARFSKKVGAGTRQDAASTAPVGPP